MPKQYQDIVDKVASGQMKLQGQGSAVPAALRAQVQAAAIAENPNWSSDLNTFYTNWTTSTTAGSDRSNVDSMNNAMKHTIAAYNSYKDLSNSNFATWNAIANKWESATGDTKTQKAIQQFETEKTLALEELSKAAKGGTLTVEDVKNTIDGIDYNSTP